MCRRLVQHIETHRRSTGAESPRGQNRSADRPDDAHARKPAWCIRAPARAGAGNIPGLLQHDRASADGLPDQRSISSTRQMPTNPAYYTEKTLCLPKTYWCYPEPDFDVVPRRQGNAITFGCLNSFTKVTEPMLQAWGRLLREVRGSNLILHCPAGSHRRRVVELLGVAADRVRMEAFMPFDRYLALQGQIDIALDPFPYGGGTTTCDALWSGTPVVSLRSHGGVSRRVQHSVERRIDGIGCSEPRRIYSVRERAGLGSHPIDYAPGRDA